MAGEAVGLAFDDTDQLKHLPASRGLGLACPELICPPDLSTEARGLARQAWEDRTRAEYVGVMIVRHFHGLLVDLNAPMDLQELALVMLLQEQQHARLCMAAARSLGADGQVTFMLEELQLARSDAPLEQQFYQALIGTYAIGEAVALELLTGSIAVLPASGYREILRLIARDEVLHGRIGHRILDQLKGSQPPRWLNWPGDDALIQMARGQIEFMRGRDLVEPAEEAAFSDARLAAELPAVGIPDSRAFRGIYDQALDQKVPAAFAELGLEL